MGFFARLFGKKNKKKEAAESKVTSVDLGLKEEAEEPKEEVKEVKEEVVTVDAPVEIVTEKITPPTEAAEEIKPKAPKKKAPAAKKEEVNKEEPAEEKAEEVTATSDTPTAITGRFEINKSKDGKKYFFNLYASNKVGIATSQMYSSAQSAMIGVKSVIANAATAPIEDQSLKNYETLGFPKWIIYVDKGGKYRFHLAAANGSNVCHSQGYTSKASCKNGIESIIRSSRNAEIDKSYLLKKSEDKA